MLWELAIASHFTDCLIWQRLHSCKWQRWDLNPGSRVWGISSLPLCCVILLKDGDKTHTSYRSPVEITRSAQVLCSSHPIILCLVKLALSEAPGFEKWGFSKRKTKPKPDLSHRERALFLLCFQLIFVLNISTFKTAVPGQKIEATPESGLFVLTMWKQHSMLFLVFFKKCLSWLQQINRSLGQKALSYHFLLWYSWVDELAQCIIPSTSFYSHPKALFLL